MPGSKVMRQSRAETLVTEEPYELIAHVRDCGGAGWATTGSTRKRPGIQLRNCLKEIIRKLPPNHRSQLRNAFCRHQSIQTCHQRVLQGGRDCQRGKRPGQLVVPV